MRVETMTSMYRVSVRVASRDVHREHAVSVGVLKLRGTGADGHGEVDRTTVFRSGKGGIAGGHRHRTDSTGRRSGASTVRLYLKRDRCLNAFGCWCEEQKLFITIA